MLDRLLKLPRHRVEIVYSEGRYWATLKTGGRTKDEAVSASTAIEAFANLNTLLHLRQGAAPSKKNII